MCVPLCECRQEHPAAQRIMPSIDELKRKRTKLAVGLLSGTSADGVDAVLVRITGSGIRTQVRQLAFVTVPYPIGMKSALLANSLPGSSSVDMVCRLNAAVAVCFADAVRRVARKARVPLSRIDLIGSHGQTIHHLPEPEKFFGMQLRSTLQIGSPSMIAVQTGIPVVGDFRTADVAAGGQGAPLVPYLDYLLFRSPRRNRMLLNLGGIANLTALPKRAALADVRAFDTGPANMVIDGLMQRLYRLPFDPGGRAAARGRIDSGLLRWMMAHPFLQKRPPKSTGREEFGRMYLDAIIRQSGHLSSEDVVATATEFTALSVYDQYVRFVRRQVRIDELFVSGGGVHNRYLMRRLATHFHPVPVLPMEELGFSSDAKEAVLFAVLANETISGRPSNVPGATGASRPVILGTIAPVA